MYNNGFIMTDTIGNNLKTKDISRVARNTIIWNSVIVS